MALLDIFPEGPSFPRRDTDSISEMDREVSVMKILPEVKYKRQTIVPSVVYHLVFSASITFPFVLCRFEFRGFSHPCRGNSSAFEARHWLCR